MKTPDLPSRTRLVTVSNLSAGNFDNPRIPTVRLIRRWLPKLVFRTGQQVHVKSSSGRLAITIQSEASDGEDSARRN